MDGPGPNGIQNLGINNNIIAYNEPIRTVMQLGYGQMCFTYATSSQVTTTTNSVNRVAAAPLATSSGGSSNSEAQVSGNIRSTLPASVLSEFFPNDAQSSSKRRRSANALSLRESTKPMPVPAPMTDAWIEMHHFDPIQVKKCYNDAVKFVKVLNSANYISPFV